MSHKLDKSNVEKILPLTALQSGMLFHYLEEPGSLQYIEQLTLKFEGNLNESAMKKAWEHVAQTNEVLRAVFRWEKLDAPVMVILKHKAIPITVLDFKDETHPEHVLEDFKQLDLKENINILENPIRVHIAKLTHTTSALVITNHHMLYDGWSNGLLIKELITAYNTVMDGEILEKISKTSYQSFINCHKNSQETEAITYWEKYLEDVTEGTNFPAKHNHKKSLKPTKYTLFLEKEMTQAINAFTKTHKITLATLLYTAWGMMLSKYTYNWDVLFGTTVSGRNAKVPGIEEMVGLFINTLPVRIKLEPNQKIIEQLKQVQKQLIEREDFEQSMLATIQNHHTPRGEGLFRTLLVVENYPIEQEIAKLSRYIALNKVETFEMTHYELTLVVQCLEQLSISFLYDCKQIDKQMIDSLAHQLNQIIAEIIQSPTKEVNTIEMLKEEDQRAMLQLNPQYTPFDKHKTLQEIFEEQVEKNGDCVALKYGENTYTYAQLNEKSNQLARYLLKKGVKRNIPVALLCDRSIEMVVAILGVLKAGGAYIPIDPEYPKSRIEAIVKDSKPKVMLTYCQHKDLAFKQCEIMEMTSLQERIGTQSSDNLDTQSQSDDLAYIMYTSGSTGEPKGTLISHYNISRVVRHTQYVTIHKEDTLLQLSNYSFDGSTFDFFGALLNGAKLVLVNSTQLLDMESLGKVIEEEKATVFFITTALFNNLMDEVPHVLESVRCLITGGERMSFEHAKKFYKRYGSGKLINGYGPTESTVFATYYPVDSVDEQNQCIPIGKPISNTKVYVLDAANKLAPIAALGEICIGGDGLAWGYLNNEILTSEKFIPNPFDDEREDSYLYRTGDLGRWNHQGELEYEGRIDQQIKLRGYRIELGEIEKALMSVEGIKQSLVTVAGEKSDEKFICAYVVGEGETLAIKEELKQYLPYYMIPQQIVFMEQFPLNKNGKVDQKALPVPQIGFIQHQYIEPSNVVEKKLQQIWQDILDYEPIGVTDAFYEVGGHSLKATRIVSHIHKVFDVKIPLATFLELMTIREISSYIMNKGQENYEPIPSAPYQETYPLSAAQRAVYLQEQFEGIGTSYHIPVALEINQKLELEPIQKAFNQLIKSHEVLRSSFAMTDEPIQRIANEVEGNVEYVRCQEEEVNQVISLFIRAFNLEEPPLIRLLYIEHEEKSLLVMDIHHIIADGISVTKLIGDFFSLYQDQEIQKPRIQYKDYAVWQKKQLEKEALLKQKSFWHNLYKDGIPVVDFPTDYVRKSKTTYEGGHKTFNIETGLSEQLKKVASRLNVSMNSLLFSAYGILLQKYSREDNFVVGSLVAGRVHSDLQDVVGMFNNYLPILMEVDIESQYEDYLKKTSDRLSLCYDNQEYPYELLTQTLHVRQTAARNPFFDTMLIYHNQLENTTFKQIDGIQVNVKEVEHGTSKLDFKLDIYHNQDEMRCIFEYAKALYNEETIERMGRHYIKLLEEIVDFRKRKVKDFSMLTQEEENCLLTHFNDTTVAYSDTKTLIDIFMEQVEKTPDQVAVTYGDHSLTYKELNKKVNSVAHKLITYGIEKEDIVGICVERSFEMIIGILAILKAGGAYMPISPDYPEDRISYMLEDSKAKMILCQKRFEKDIKGVAYLTLDDDAVYEGAHENIDRGCTSRQLAYVIYTSGSTGNPKGVMIEQHSVVNRIQWMQKKYPIGMNDRILQKTPYTFDVSVWELFWWMFTGSSVHFLEPQGEKDPNQILEAIEKHQITTMHFVPSMLTVFLEYYEVNQSRYNLSTLRQVFASGEALTIAQVKKFNNIIYTAYKTTLHNLYGPTEATVDVSYFDCPTTQEVSKVPIGKPIDNTRLYVLDEDRKLQPIGVPGELYISGVNVGRGYLNKPSLTNEKFMDDPYYEGYKMYRSGDLCRYLEDGNIEYLGRIDHQVKLRGLRIELGEIESRLSMYEGIVENVVVVKEDLKNNQYLCAYYVSNQEIDSNTLRKHVGEKLPDYMIPTFFVKIEKMPLSANGKLDRKRLPEIDFKALINQCYEEATSETELKLKKIWLKLLDIDDIGINHNFFELGGHSLMAAKLIAELQNTFGVQLTLNKVFEKPTIKEQAYEIEHTTIKSMKPVEKAEERLEYPLSPAQERLYILNKIEPGVTYNLPCVLKIEGDLQENRFKDSLAQLVDKNQQLRTSFHTQEGVPVQKIHQEVKLKLKTIECSQQEVEKYINNFIQPFDLEEPSQVRFLLLKVDNQTHYFAFDMHHIIADGVSSVLLAKAFMSYYNDEVEKVCEYDYVDYVLWKEKQKEDLLKDEVFWREKLSGPLPVLDIQTDYQRPSTQDFEGRKINFEIDRNLVQGIREQANKYNMTPYMFCLAAYNILLYKYTGQEDFIIGTPVAGRDRIEFENIIGMFVNTIVLRNSPVGNKNAHQFLEEVKANSLNAFDHQDYPFEMLIQLLNVKRDLSRNPLFDTMFTYQNMGIPQMVSKDETIIFSAYPLDTHVSKFDLTLEIVEDTEDWGLHIEYASSLFKASTIERMAKHYKMLLEKMVDTIDCNIEDYHLITEEEEVFIHQEFNNTETPYTRDITLHEVLERQVKRTPERIAAYFGEQSITYKKLNEKANSLALLLREKGVGKNDIVGLMTERSLEMTIGIFAILKAGGAYMPISPDYPTDRIAYMLEDSKAKVVLTQERFTERLQKIDSINLQDETLYTKVIDDIEPVNDPKQLAYVIYTSGSTGKPKGVMIEHTSAINRIEWMQKSYPLNENDKILQKTPFTFDVSVWELFWWSFTGSCVYFLEPNGEKDPQCMLQMIQANQITTMHFVPSMLSVFLEYFEIFKDKYDIRCLKQVFASGEALTIPQVETFNKLLACNGTKLYNLYGPTEATVDVSYYNCPTSGTVTSVPIGKPIDNTRLYVLDKKKRIQPIGVAGELYISGVNVGRGYLNQEVLTTEKFMDDPFYQGYRMYKSGDLVKLTEEGEIEYLGRIDHQVKLRGLRIELGEIESRIAQYPNIVESAVLLREDAKGEKYLCGYYTEKEEISVEDLKKSLAKKLPEYMIPNYFMKLDVMPLSPNGKLDRRALPEPDRSLSTENEYVAAENEIQEKLVSLWEQLLQHDNIGIYDNFFDLGGHSLLLVKLHAEIEKMYPGVVRVTDLFEHTNIYKLSGFIESQYSSLSQVYDLRGIEVKEMYLMHETGIEISDTLSFTFQKDLINEVNEISSLLHVEVQDILLAAYLVYIAQLNEHSETCVEIAGEKSMQTLAMKMSNYERFDVFIRDLNETRLTLATSYSYESAVRQETTQNIVFAYVSEVSTRSENEWLKKYDVILGGNNKGQLRLFYNTRKVRKDVMGTFIDTYLKLLIYILKEIESSSRIDKTV